MDRKDYIKGLGSGALAYTLWGLLPLYWKWVNVVDAYQIFAHRILWSVVFLMAILFVKGQFSGLKAAMQDKSKRFNVLMCTLFISINWMLYIWGVNNGYVIEASLGYYINPMVLTGLGALLYKERMDGLQMIGFVLAAIGVIYLTVSYGRVPFIALTLAFSFAFYGAFKKRSQLDSLTGLSFETLIILTPCLVYILFSEFTGRGFIVNTAPVYWFIITLSGVATTVPLLLYSEAAKKLPLGVVGFLQYISPTISLFLGIFVFKEAFDTTKLIAFIFIWVALGFYSVSQVRMLSKK